MCERYGVRNFTLIQIPFSEFFAVNRCAGDVTDARMRRAIRAPQHFLFAAKMHVLRYEDAFFADQRHATRSYEQRHLSHLDGGLSEN